MRHIIGEITSFSAMIIMRSCWSDIAEGSVFFLWYNNAVSEELNVNHIFATEG